VAVHGLACCRDCPDRQAAPWLAADSVRTERLIQEIQGPFQPGRPRDWHTRPEVLEAHRVLFARTRESLIQTERSPLPAGEGRGIVTCGGGAVYFTCAYVLISLLRRLGCTLPCEVWHLGWQEMDPHMASLLEGLGQVRVRDCHQTPGRRPRILGGWESKLWALLHSDFREALWLDADHVPPVDPTGCFDWPEYLDRGCILWPDARNEWGLDVTEDAFRVAGLPVPGRQRRPRHFRPADYRPVESGQVLVDRGRRWRELLLAMHVCEHADFWYPQGTGNDRRHWHIYGDKSAFLLAWEALGGQYRMPPDCGWAGSSKGGAFLQRDFRGQVVFQHRCQPVSKWSLHGDNHDSGLVHFPLALEALARLREQWPGHPWAGPHEDARERSLAQGLPGEWHWTGPAGREQRITLRADRTLHPTPVPGALHWSVRYLDERPWLVFASRRKAEMALPWQDGCFHAKGEGSAGPCLVRACPPGWRTREGMDLAVWDEVVRHNAYRLPDDMTGWVVVDVGAHIGAFAHACLARGAKQVHCVEPDPGNLELLRANLGADPRVVIWPVAAWRADVPGAVLHLRRPPGAEHAAGGCVTLGAQGASVPAVPLRSILDAAGRDEQGVIQPVHLVKLDCEGAEWPILDTGLSTFLPGRVVGEYHEAALLPERRDPVLWCGIDAPAPGKGRDWLARRLAWQGFAVEFAPHPKDPLLGLFFAQRAQIP